MAGWSERPQKYRPGRPYIQHHIRTVVAARQGAIQGQETIIHCPKCGAEGRIYWSKPKVRKSKSGQVYTRGLHLDHIHPKSKGGADTADNLQYLCARCNLLKKDSVQ